jgi:hypothetical protein
MLVNLGHDSQSIQAQFPANKSREAHPHLIKFWTRPKFSREVPQERPEKAVELRSTVAGPIFVVVDDS